MFTPRGETWAPLKVVAPPPQKYESSRLAGQSKILQGNKVIVDAVGLALGVLGEK
jgi:hypothetical protein